jgi:hypothetical protein
VDATMAGCKEMEEKGYTAMKEAEAHNKNEGRGDNCVCLAVKNKSI